VFPAAQTARRAFPASARLRLAFVFAGVLVLALAPMLLLLSHLAATGRDDQRIEAQARLLQAARFAAGTQAEALALLERSLALLGAEPPDWAETEAGCVAKLRTMVETHPFMAGATVVRRDGSAICASAGSADGVSISDRGYFRSAVRYDGLAVGDAVISRFSGTLILPVALRMQSTLDVEGNPPAVLAAALDVGRIARLLAGTQNLQGSEAGGRVLVFDYDGRMLVQYPRAGDTPDTYPFLQAQLAVPEGIADVTGSDGVRRLAGFVHGTQGNLIYTATILSSSVTRPADARFRNVMGLAVLAAMLGLLSAFLIAQRLVLRPVSVLAEAAIHENRPEARALLERRLPGEFDVLRRAMRDMLHAVDSREAGLEQANRDLERLAGRDALTGLANRRAFDAALAEAWARCLRDGESIAVAIFDVDHFKCFNDRYGHLNGDEVLRKMAEALNAIPLRDRDLSARLGGEEFVILLPGTETPGAAIVAERGLAAIRGRMILHEDSPQGLVTASVGVAACRPIPGIAPAALLAAADAALYRAKDAGRDRMVTAREVARLGPALPVADHSLT
jgi:diguanylate cyclase (GGDEF)-like protein